jgi:hypothetical protein
MFINNELSLKLIKDNLIVKDLHVNIMLELFVVNLAISGMILLLQNNAKAKYNDDFNRWHQVVRWKMFKLIASRSVDVKSKIRIIGFIISPHLWSILAKQKRNKEFIDSV